MYSGKCKCKCKYAYKPDRSTQYNLITHNYKQVLYIQASSLGIWRETFRNLRKQSISVSQVFFCSPPTLPPLKIHFPEKICIYQKPLRNIYMSMIYYKIIYSVCFLCRPCFLPLKHNFLTIHVNKDYVSSVSQFHLNCESFVSNFWPS